MHCDPRFCFVAPRLLEQQEEGDTLWHGFRYEPTDLTKPIWFYLSGTINGIDSPSTSPIMHLPVMTDIPYQTKYQRRIMLMCRHVTYNVPRAMNFKAPALSALDGIEIELFDPKTNLESTLALYDTFAADGKPKSLIESTTITILPPKFEYLKLNWFYYPLRHLQLTPNEMYAIVLIGDQSEPNTSSLCWFMKFRPPLDEDEYGWIGQRVGAAIVWTRSEFNVFTYRSWINTPFYQPGPPTPEQIPS